MIIDYGDTPNKKKEEEKDNTLLNSLTEMPVDPGYEIEVLKPVEMELLNFIRAKFAPRGLDPIPNSELMATTWSFGGTIGVRFSPFAVTTMIRRLWKAGYIRRFVKWKTATTKKQPGRGEYRGVHYILYPKNQKETDYEWIK